jgi:hypothetical protein
MGGAARHCRAYFEKAWVRQSGTVPPLGHNGRDVVVKKDKKSAMIRQILKVAYQRSSAHSHAWDKVVARNLTKAVILDISSLD